MVKNGPHGEPPDRELTDEERRWIREERQRAERITWLLSIIRTVGISVTATLVALASAITALKEILKAWK